MRTREEAGEQGENCSRFFPFAPEASSNDATCLKSSEPTPVAHGGNPQNRADLPTQWLPHTPCPMPHAQIRFSETDNYCSHSWEYCDRLFFCACNVVENLFSQLNIGHILTTVFLKVKSQNSEYSTHVPLQESKLCAASRS